jgi:adenylosuccinate synthase
MPFVTSSDPSIQGLASGVGLAERDVDIAFGIVKAYITRVGKGPFPTEFGGKESEIYCDDYSNNREYEWETFKEATVNHENEFIQGIGFRIQGGEYGATTKRPRRTGWLDLVSLKYAMQFNGPVLFLTKADVLDNCKEIKICTQYEYSGSDYFFGGKMLKKGDILDVFPADSTVLERIKPKYATFNGWECSTADVRELEKLPKELLKVIAFIEEQTGGKIKGLSNGPSREQIVFF